MNITWLLAGQIRPRPRGASLCGAILQGSCDLESGVSPRRQSGGGWPGTFGDVRNGMVSSRGSPKNTTLDLTRTLVMGHSAGGQLALCLAGHEPSVKRVYFAGRCGRFAAGLGTSPKQRRGVEFLGGNRRTSLNIITRPTRAAQDRRNRVADPWGPDDSVPASLSRHYAEQKKRVARTSTIWKSQRQAMTISSIPFQAHGQRSRAPYCIFCLDTAKNLT